MPPPGQRGVDAQLLGRVVLAAVAAVEQVEVDLVRRPTRAGSTVSSSARRAEHRVGRRTGRPRRPRPAGSRRARRWPRRRRPRARPRRAARAAARRPARPGGVAARRGARAARAGSARRLQRAERDDAREQAELDQDGAAEGGVDELVDRVDRISRHWTMPPRSSDHRDGEPPASRSAACPRPAGRVRSAGSSARGGWRSTATRTTSPPSQAPAASTCSTLAGRLQRDRRLRAGVAAEAGQERERGDGQRERGERGPARGRASAVGAQRGRPQGRQARAARRGERRSSSQASTPRPHTRPKRVVEHVADRPSGRARPRRSCRRRWRPGARSRPRR